MPTEDSLTAILRPFVLAAFSLLPAAGRPGRSQCGGRRGTARRGVAGFIFMATIFFENSKLKESKTCIIFFNYFKINVIVQSYD